MTAGPEPTSGLFVLGACAVTYLWTFIGITGKMSFKVRKCPDDGSGLYDHTNVDHRISFLSPYIESYGLSI